MQEPVDDLEMLLRDVRKNILENHQFLRTLADDAVEAEEGNPTGDADEAIESGEDFEEL
jgi:hypothetical protein